MRAAKCIFLSLLLGAVSFNTYSQANSNTTGTPAAGTTVKMPKYPKDPKDKPKAPSNQRVEFAYSPATHTGTFDFCNSNALYLSVEIENLLSGEVHYGNVDASYPVMEVYLEPSTYSISCTTEDGSLYAGEFEIY